MMLKPISDFLRGRQKKERANKTFTKLPKKLSDKNSKKRGQLN